MVADCTQEVYPSFAPASLVLVIQQPRNLSKPPGDFCLQLFDPTDGFLLLGLTKQFLDPLQLLGSLPDDPLDGTNFSGIVVLRVVRHARITSDTILKHLRLQHMVLHAWPSGPGVRK